MIHNPLRCEVRFAWTYFKTNDGYKSSGEVTQEEYENRVGDTGIEFRKISPWLDTVIDLGDIAMPKKLIDESNGDEVTIVDWKLITGNERSFLKLAIKLPFNEVANKLCAVSKLRELEIEQRKIDTLNSKKHFIVSLVKELKYPAGIALFIIYILNM